MNAPANLRALIAKDPALVRAFSAHGGHYVRTGLHAAATAGHADAVRLLLEHGADPNAREAGDNTYPLHWAAAAGNIEIVRALLDAGGDVHGFGDAHDLDVIGWATNENAHRAEVLSLLLERGARHHIFSAINIGDLALIEKVVEENPAALDRRMSRFERGQTPLHLAIGRKRYDILESIYYPSKVISDQYRSTTIFTRKGQRVDGLAAPQGDQITVLQSDGTKVTLKKDEIEQQVASLVSVMPEKLLDTLTDQQIRDLFAYLQTEAANP